jgi:site-specific recombinase XerD
MFDQLFERPHALARHRSGPLVEERRAFLAHLADLGCARSTLQHTACDLLAIAKMLGFARRRHRIVTRDDIKRRLAQKPCFYPIAVRWLQFVGHLPLQPVAVSTYAKKITAFADHMERDKGLAPATIRGRCWLVARFLDRLNIPGGSLQKITPRRIDVSLQEMLAPRRYARTTVQTWAEGLRAFFRFAETQGWCRKGLAATIRGPRVFSQASLPLGPSWDDVERLLAMTESDKPHDLRARPMLLLFAIYGLRAGEVTHLRLDDLDWEHELLQIVSSKTKRVRTYPLIRSVGDAILRYLQEVRPRSLHRELFLSLRPPFGPLRASPGDTVARRLKSLGVSLPHYGPHALRHACAARLLADGLSLKEIGDQLGHTDPDTTRIYAKVDLAGLRQVADFDLGGVL